MKQKYIVGDLVRISFISDDKIFEIIEGGTINPYIAKDMDGKEAIAEEHSIIPIPITPDILEKNGWNGDEIINIYIHKSFNIAGAFDRKGFHVVISDVNDDNKKANVGIFKYVHELQHLLFGLGLNSYIEVYV